MGKACHTLCCGRDAEYVIAWSGDRIGGTRTKCAQCKEVFVDAAKLSDVDLDVREMADRQPEGFDDE